MRRFQAMFAQRLYNHPPVKESVSPPSLNNIGKGINNLDEATQLIVC